jgi:hypothetical protein
VDPSAYIRGRQAWIVGQTQRLIRDGLVDELK